MKADVDVAGPNFLVGLEKPMAAIMRRRDSIVRLRYYGQTKRRLKREGAGKHLHVEG